MLAAFSHWQRVCSGFWEVSELSIKQAFPPAGEYVLINIPNELPSLPSIIHYSQSSSGGIADQTSHSDSSRLLSTDAMPSFEPLIFLKQIGLR